MYINYFIEFILIYFKEKQTANEVQTQQEQPKVKEQGAKKKHGNEDLESKKKAPKKAKKEPTTQVEDSEYEEEVKQEVKQEVKEVIFYAKRVRDAGPTDGQRGATTRHEFVRGQHRRPQPLLGFAVGAGVR